MKTEGRTELEKYLLEQLKNVKAELEKAKAEKKAYYDELMQYEIVSCAVPDTPVGKVLWELIHDVDESEVEHQIYGHSDTLPETYRCLAKHVRDVRAVLIEYSHPIPRTEEEDRELADRLLMSVRGPVERRVPNPDRPKP